MDYSRRYMAVRDENSAIAFTALLTCAQGRTILKTERGERELEKVVVFDGKNFAEYGFNEVIALDIVLSDEISVLYYGGGNRYFSRLGGEFSDAETFAHEYGKAAAEKDRDKAQTDEDLFGYDDEKIAEENYFVKVGYGESEGLQDARPQTKEKTFGKIGKGGAQSRADDGGEDSCREPTNPSASGDLAEPDRKAFYERGQAEKRQSDIKGLLAAFPADPALEEMIPCGKFCRDGDRVAGLITVGERRYVCVGKTGRADSFELSSANVFFVPKSHFTKTDGYLLSFSPVEADEYVEKRFTERKKSAIIDV